ncbi:MAG: hypothetical protein IKM07_04055 [Clostridia bacterium]|nr:hypothetical protein [Clostridia bacterium]
MITIQNEIIKKQPNFWNQCLFHPTDAIEDPWGKRILDRISADGAIKTVRIYTMFEDIVYIGENGELCYDFRVSDLRLDYMVEKGFDLLLAYAGMPDCIAASTGNKTSVSKNKTRYKGKMWNSAPPKDYALWEDICYEYTRHIVERYGIETVSKWRCQCFNEPDIPAFFMSELPGTTEDTVKYRLPAYCKLYAAFERGIRRVSDRILIGGPALAHHQAFLGGWLDYVREHNLKLDFISVHNYGVSPRELNDGSKVISVQNNMRKHQPCVDTVKAHGYDHLPLLVDEWGFSSAGFYNREECPALMGRETELFSAYFVKLIHEFVYSDYKIDMLCICLSGQHEMVEDFSGFRNFFTLNFIAKPIYNAYILSAALHENLLASEYGSNLFVVPTKDDQGNFAALISYSSGIFDENLPAISETVVLPEEFRGKTVTVWCIDRNTTNPYRLYQKMGIDQPGEDDLRVLREEGRLKPVLIQSASEPLTLELTANSVFLITAAE